MQAAAQTCRIKQLDVTGGILNPETPLKCVEFDETRRNMATIIATPRAEGKADHGDVMLREYEGSV